MEFQSISDVIFQVMEPKYDDFKSLLACRRETEDERKLKYGEWRSIFGAQVPKLLKYFGSDILYYWRKFSKFSSAAQALDANIDGRLMPRRLMPLLMPNI